MSNMSNSLKITYYVAFSMSTCLLRGGACGLDLISPTKCVMPSRRSVEMIHNFSLYQGLSLHPPCPLTFFFCFFHVDSVD